MKFASAIILLLALLPSAFLAWTFRDMPQLGEAHDDAVLLASAKSLAEGRGYRIASLPGEPFQTKYPPLYPALLATVWTSGASFPGNLSRAMAIAWAPLPLLAVLSAILFRRFGLSSPIAALLSAAIVLNPYTILFAVSLRTEVLFSLFLIASLLSLERWPLLAGLFAGCAYATRTAGIALLLAVVLVTIWRREYRKILLFTTAATPFVVIWSWWVSTHRFATSDPHLLYYLDYLKFGLANQNWGNIHLFVWTNAWAILEGAGGLLLTDAGKSMTVRAFLVVISSAVLAGLARSAKMRETQTYIAFSIVYTGILLFWHFPPGARFLYPLFPLLLFGIYVEARWLMGAASRSRQQSAAKILLLGLACCGLWIVWSEYRFVANTIPANLTAHHQRLQASLEGFQWIKANLPEDATILAPNDGPLYLHTGRHAMNIITPTAYFYENRKDKILGVQHELVNFAIERRLQYIYIDKRFRYHLDDKEQLDAFDRVRRDPRVRVAYASGAIALYELRPNERKAGPETD